MHESHVFPPETPDYREYAAPKRFSTVAMLRNLVLLPGLVVLTLVLIAVAFGWLTNRGGNVDSLVKSLSTPGKARWLAALDLATMLKESEDASMRRDPALAGRLGELLWKELQSGRAEPGDLLLQTYLCRALGEFHVADPLPALIEAARIGRRDENTDVRRAAIESLAVLAGRVGPEVVRADRKVTPCLLTAAEDADRQIRLAAAFALGVVGGDEAETRLENMLADEYPEVRYNAATGLARSGNAVCIDVLLDMLSGNQITLDGGFHRAMVQLNALRAVGMLCDTNPEADLSRLQPAIVKIQSETDVAPAVRAKAVEVLARLRTR